MTAPTKLIPVSSAILKRQKEVGDAIWVYLWLLDHITQVKPAEDGRQQALVSDGVKLKATLIAKDLGLPASTVKRHLKTLGAAGLVSNKGAAAAEGFTEDGVL